MRPCWAITQHPNKNTCLLCRHGGHCYIVAVSREVLPTPCLAVHRDMVRLWRLAGRRYEASQLDVLAATGRDYSMLDEFPEEYGQARAIRNV